MHRIPRLLLLAALSVLSTCAISAPRYGVTEFPAVSSDMPLSFGMNERGIFAYATDYGDGQRVYLTAPTLHVLPQFDGLNTYVGGVNTAGTIAGAITEQTPDGALDRPFLYSGGTLTRLNVPGIYSGSAYVINEQGMIAGGGYVSPNSNAYSAFRYLDGHADLFALPGARFTVPEAINNRGMVVGRADFRTPDFLLPHAVVYDGTRVMDLQQPGWYNSEATQINDRGDIVGYFGTDHGTGGGFLYRDGQMSVLQGPDGASFFPVDINNRGDILGTSVAADGTHRMAVQFDGQFHFLGDLLDNGRPGYYYFLNDARQIGAIWITASGDNQLVLLSPVPEPTAIAMLCTGLLVAGLRRRRERADT